MEDFMTITSSHDLGGFQRDMPISPENPGKSRYCYLFDAPPGDGEGLFVDPPADDLQTIQRLLKIATWLEIQAADDPQNGLSLRMNLPAAYTYFGQFVNHDISAPVGGMLQDVNAISDAVVVGNAPLFVGKLWRGTVDDILLHFQNEHENPMTLASLYGKGPEGAPQMYDGAKLKLGQTRLSPLGFDAVTGNPDLVRRMKGAPDIPRELNPARPAGALIADLRNDENLLLSQVHLAMMLLHNKAVDAQPPGKGATLFADARNLVLRHYHWCILHDLLPSLLTRGVLDKVLAAPSRLTKAEVPMEFTTAAFRFGHSMVSNGYDYNANFGQEAVIARRASLSEMIQFTSRGGMGGLGEHDPLPDHWVVDWDRLSGPRPRPEAAGDKIDVHFAQAMMNAVQKNNDGMGSIIARNLARGFHRRIPFGQALAESYHLNGLSAEQIAAAMPRGLQSDPAHPDEGDALTERMAILTQTPAWLYVLCEAQALEGGERLGPLASHIIADTFVGLMRLQEDSILGQEGWQPEDSPLRHEGRPIATIRDLLLFAVAGQGVPVLGPEG